MSRPPRLNGFDYRGGHRYFLTMCAYRRRFVFTDVGTIDLVIEQIRFTSAEQGIENIAYCFLWDHLHMLVAGTCESSDLRKFATLMKQRSAWRFARLGQGPLWQAGYYDRVLRHEEATAGVVQYIIQNPVRAKLVESPGDYPHWGSGLYTREELLDFVKDASQWRPGTRTVRRA
jgi:putative transposase